MPFGKNLEKPGADQGQNAEKETASAQERINRIKMKLDLGQVRFAATLYQKEKGRRPFHQILIENTAVGEELLEALQLEYGTDDQLEVGAQLDRIENNFLQMFQGDDPKRFVYLLGSILAITITAQEKPLTAAEIDYESIGLFAIERRRLKGLESYGISPQDELLEIHYEPIRRHLQGKVNPFGLRKDFEEIATYLEKNPEIKAVIADSWLVDHPVAKSIGFVQVPKIRTRTTKLSIWMQFLGKDGNLKEAELEKAIQEGKLPFQGVFGMVPAKTFIDKFKAHPKPQSPTSAAL